MMFNIYQQSLKQTQTLIELRRIRDEAELRPLLESAFLVTPNGTFFYQSVDVVQVQNIGKKAKNTYRWSKFSLHKKFKLILEENVNNKHILKKVVDVKNVQFYHEFRNFIL